MRIFNIVENGEIHINGEVGQNIFGDGYDYDNFKADLSKISGDIVVNIKSYGGDVHEAMAIYDLLRITENNVITKIVGATASAGTIIGMAGDKRLITANSRYLIHKVMTGVYGNSDDFEKAISQLKDYDKQLIAIYVKKSKLNDKAIFALMQEEKFISAQDALKYGFVDEIIEEKTIKKNEKKMNEILELLNASTENEATAKVKNLLDRQKGVDVIAAKLMKAESEKEEVEKELTDKEKEIEELKSKIAGLEKEIEEEEKEKAQKNAEETEEEVDAAVKEGKVSAGAKETLIALGNEKGVESLRKILNSIAVNFQSISDFVKRNPEMSNITDKKTALEAWKSGKIKTADYEAAIKNLKN